MTDTTEMNLKGNFDPAVAALSRGAHDNLPDLCAQFFGKAKAGNIMVNSASLRIAAENKSYEAFERMLNIVGEHSFGVTSNYSIGLGHDWDRIEEIARCDERIAAALRLYERKSSENLREMLNDASVDDTIDYGPPQLSSQGFFSRLRFW